MFISGSLVTQIYVLLWIKLYAYWQGMTFIWALYGGYISVTVGCISSWNIDIFFEFMDCCFFM